MEKRIFNPLTGEITTQEVADELVSIESVRSDILLSLYNLYQEKLENGFISSASGTTIQYGYDSNYQLIYSKWANVLALDPNRESITFSTPNSTIVTLTRVQFIQFMNDAEQFELGLFNNKMSFEEQIKNASTVDELNTMVINL